MVVIGSPYALAIVGKHPIIAPDQFTGTGSRLSRLPN